MMERFNWRKRTQDTRRKGAIAPRISNRPPRKLPLIAAAGIAAFLVLAVLASLFTNARKSSPAIVTTGLPVPAPQSTAATMKAPTNMDAAAGYGAANSERQAQTAPASGGATTQNQDAASSQASKDWDRMIIRTATLQLRVKDVAASMDQVRMLAGAHAGYVTQSDSHQEGDYTVATITMQVPAAEFDSTVSQLRKSGLKVLNEQVSSSDVTEEYTDLNSQLRNLQATEQRILVLTQKADKIEDILALDRELRQIQGEIERIQGRVNFLSKRSEMSTIAVTLYPDTPAVEPTSKPIEGWNPQGIAANAWHASLDLLANIGTLVITVAVFLWWAVPLLALAWLFSRRYRRSSPPPAMAAEP